MRSQQQGKLYLIPTPLLEHAPLYLLPQDKIVIATLKYFIVENAKTARKWLKVFGIQEQLNKVNLLEINRHFLDDEKQLIQFLCQGQRIGLLSDAGCPAVADPGALVVRIAHRLKWEVVPLIGPSSIILALMASGGNGQYFRFNGYLPIKEEERKKALRVMLRRLDEENETQLFIETPYRNQKLYCYLLQALPDNLELTLAIDLTDLERQFIRRLTIKEWKESSNPFIKPHRRQSVFVLG